MRDNPLETKPAVASYSGVADAWTRIGELLWEAVSAETNSQRIQAVSIASDTAGRPASTTPQSALVLSLLQEAGDVAPIEISARLRWSRSKTLRITTELLNTGEIEKHGSTRDMKYSLATRERPVG